VSAKLLGAMEEHGEERVRPALEAALTQQRVGVLDVIARTPELRHSWPPPLASSR
jgi:hypothetical protein